MSLAITVEGKPENKPPKKKFKFTVRNLNRYFEEQFECIIRNGCEEVVLRRKLSHKLSAACKPDDRMSKRSLNRF